MRRRDRGLLPAPVIVCTHTERPRDGIVRAVAGVTARTHPASGRRLPVTGYGE